ncbi:SMC5-SMC6 complex localization factor protein 2 [Genypterus blacodes]|uniref:SMC5-SMC6 complex localization factor protein 2 n=1 Tax=Genypterus blacodes TaxID=154954 RepID=UPI003F766F6C
MVKMRKSSENEGNAHTNKEYFSPKSKVKKDLPLQQRHLMSLLQETPIKPSQIPNRLPYTLPRRMLPLQSPKLCSGERLGPLPHTPQPQGPIRSQRFCPSSPTSLSHSAKRPQTVQGNRQSCPQRSPQSTGSVCSPGFAPNSPMPAKSQQSTPLTSSNLRSPKDFIPLAKNRDQVTKCKVNLSSKANAKQNSNKPHRPSAPPFLTTGTGQDVCPLPSNGHRQPQCNQSIPTTHTERKSGSDVSVTHRPVTALQDQHQNGSASSETGLPGGVCCSPSQKRHREAEDSDGDNGKKPCLQGECSGKRQTPKCMAGNSDTKDTPHESPSRHSSAKTTEGHLCTEPASGKLPSTPEPAQSSCASPKAHVPSPRRLQSGAKQIFINSSHDNILRLKDIRSPSKTQEDCIKKGTEEKHIRETAHSPSSRGTSHNVLLDKHCTGHTRQSTSVSSGKIQSRVNQVEENKNLESRISKLNSGSPSSRIVERNKASRPRRPTVIPDDINDLFTPDPLTYVVPPPHKSAKPKMDGGENNSPTLQKSSPSTVTSCSSPCTGTPSHKVQNPIVPGSPHPLTDTHNSAFSPALQPKVHLPIVVLERVQLKNFGPHSIKGSPTRSDRHRSAKTEEDSKNVRPCTLETDPSTAKQTSTSQDSLSISQDKERTEGDRKQADEVDPLDVELDLGLSLELDLDLTQSSQSSEEEQLLSLQEMMECITKPPNTPEKGTYSDPSTPRKPSCQSKPQPLPSTTKMGIYSNNLDQMLKEINSSKKAKETEEKLLTACEEGLLRIAEFEEEEEDQPEAISTEQQEFLQRFSLMSNAIREVPPGEVVFNLENFGRIYNQSTLDLRRCMINPQDTAQKTLLWSSPAQLRLHINIGLFQEAYGCHPCPSQVTRFLFKMMSVHTERMLSEKILQAICDIACTAAYEIVKSGSQQFKVWVPSIADVTLALMNMGASFVTLFPFENLQPPFTEGDLLEDDCINHESHCSRKEQSTFPEHNCNNILKYLSYCMALCPKAYSDTQLVMLLTMMGKVSLDTRLILLPSTDHYTLQYKIINNIRNWDTMLPRICSALTELTDDHHNMCLLVHLLPDHTRGKQLRRHLSLSMISKLLNGNCTYMPTDKEFKLSDLRPYLPRMQPSALLRGTLNASREAQSEEEDLATLDQQIYYLCYSLLTLVNEASNCQFFSAQEKEQLLLLSFDLDTHIKADIRESEKCLYRSKVKDLVARMYTKWQILLPRTRPLNDQIYDYWQPPSVGSLSRRCQNEEMDTGADNLGAAVEEQQPDMEEDSGGEETGEENKLTVSCEMEFEEETLVAEVANAQLEKTAELKEDEAVEGTVKEEEEPVQSVQVDLTQRTPGMEPSVHESDVTGVQTQARDTEDT